MHMSTPIIFHATNGTTRTIYMKSRADAERLIEMTEQAEHWAQLSEQVLNHINAHMDREKLANENR